MSTLAIKKFEEYIKFYTPSFGQNEDEFGHVKPNTWSVCEDKHVEDCETCAVTDRCASAGLLTDKEMVQLRKDYPEYFV
jgi:hypothetical protein